MTIKELKELLQRYIDEYEDTYGEVAEVRCVSNTYFLHGAQNFIATKEGFIDLDNPLDDEEDYEQRLFNQ